MERKIGIYSLVVLLSLVSLNLPLEAEDSLFNSPQDSKTDWQKSVIKAKGYGVAPSYIKNDGHAKIMAREAAITIAQRHLLERIKKVKIDAQQTVENNQIQSDTIIKRVKGAIQGAYIVKEKKLPDNAYMVVMELKFYGKNGVIKAIFPELEEQKGGNNQSQATMNQSQVNDTQVNIEQGSSYTGIIINTLNLNVKAAMAPKIYNNQDQLIYGRSKVRRSSVVKNGIVGYTRSLADAKVNPRVGDKPLIINALGIKGRYKTDLVLSKADARKVKQIGKINNIFKNSKLIIVLN
ncbi:hypothetical protein JCM16358_12590 [Halanaerocella petrolearia]